MRSYQMAIGLIGIVVAITVAIGFTLIGSPIDQTAIRYDETRYNDFRQIKLAVESYYTNNGALPQSLQDLNYGNLTIIDPLTEKQYTYQVNSVDTYDLCTDFSTDAEEFRKQSSNYYDETPANHQFGYSCVSYSIPPYIKDQQNVPPPVIVR